MLLQIVIRKLSVLANFLLMNIAYVYKITIKRLCHYMLVQNDILTNVY